MLPISFFDYLDRKQSSKISTLNWHFIVEWTEFGILGMKLLYFTGDQTNNDEYI
jgi:hypothetical protein